MLKGRDKLYQVYHTFLSMGLTWALTLAINDYYVLRVHVLLCAAFSLIPAAVCYLFDRYRKNTITIILFSGVIPMLGLIFWIKKVNPIIWIGNIARWVYNYDCTKELYVFSHAHFVLLGVAVLGSILFYLMMKNQITKAAVAVLVLVLLVFSSISDITIHKFVVGICIFYILTIIVEISGMFYSRKLGKTEKKVGILYLTPVCLLLAILSVAMPSNDQPIQWKSVKYIYHKVKDGIDNILSEWKLFIDGKEVGEFSLAFAGYSEDSGELGMGELISNNEIALFASNHQGSNPTYLIGSVYDIYTSHSWEKSKMDYLPEEQEYNLDYLELVFGMSRLKGYKIDYNKYIERKTVNIKYNQIKTKSFFYPLKSSSYDFIHIDMEAPDTKSPNIVFDKPVKKDTIYRCIYYDMDLKNIKFQEMLRRAESFSYEESGSVDVEKLTFLEDNIFSQDSADSILKKWDFYEVLKERAGRIKEQYTVLPDTLPDRVRQLAFKITKDQTTSYDKLKAIEQYLTEYTYTTKPGPVPEDSDFVDYFLFDNKKGYCTSFATSMAIMARCIGIPTRYVEGFVVDYKDRVNTEYAVRNSKAHAWTEAYIEGIGWIPFEATPPYYDQRYVTWKEKKKQDSSGGKAVVYGDEPTPSIPLHRDVTAINSAIKKKKEISNWLIGVVVILLTIVIIFITLLIYDSILRYQYRKSFEKADYSRRMYLLFLRILKLLKQEGFLLDTQETVLMLSDRIKDRFKFNKIIFRDVANIFMRYRYAQEDITKNEFDKVETFYQGLLNKKREETGKLRMHLDEFLFLTKKDNR